MMLSDSTSVSEIPPESTMMPMILGYWVSRCIYVVAKLGIADLLQEGSVHCDILAAATNTHSDSLYRVLRLLAGIGIFAETEPRCFQLTPLAACLQSNVSNSLRLDAILRGEDHYYRAWGNLMHSVQTGESAFENLYGMNLFEYNAQNLTHGQMFDRVMAESSDEHAAILAAYDFSSIGKLVDIGGGQGGLLAAILQANPTMTGVLFERPNVIDKAKNFMETTAISDRCQLIGGDFLQAVPAGGDAYVLKHVVHNWDDRQAIAILQSCYQAMGEQGRLLVIDYVIPPGNELFSGKFMDVNMLVMCPGGRERTESEYRELFKSAGFKLGKIIPTEMEVSIIEGVCNKGYSG